MFPLSFFARSFARPDSDISRAMIDGPIKKKMMPADTPRMQRRDEIALHALCEHRLACADAVKTGNIKKKSIFMSSR